MALSNQGADVEGQPVRYGGPSGGAAMGVTVQLLSEGSVFVQENRGCECGSLGPFLWGAVVDR